MAKIVDDSVLDAALTKIATSTTMSACSAQPTTRTEAVTTFMLASTTMAGGDYANANGNTSGRKVTMGAKAAVTITNSGTATHIALCDGSTLLYVTTCTAQALTAAGTVDFPSWKVELADPV